MAEIDETLEHLLVLGAVQYVNGSFVVNGQTITGMSSYTWAEFIDSGFDLTVARHVKVTDRHSCFNGVSTPGSLWWIDPTAVTARKRNLVSGPIYSNTFANVLSNYPAATWPGLQVYPDDLNNVLYNDATDYKLLNTRGFIISEVNGTIASPTKTLGNGAAPQLFTLANNALPANLVKVGNRLRVNFQLKRHGTGTMVFAIALGTGATLGDGLIWSSGIASTDNAFILGEVMITVTGANSFTSSGTSAQFNTGTISLLTDQSTNVDFGAAQTFKAGLSTKATSTDSLDLLSLSVELITP